MKWGKIKRQKLKSFSQIATRFPPITTTPKEGDSSNCQKAERRTVSSEHFDLVFVLPWAADFTTAEAAAPTAGTAAGGWPQLPGLFPDSADDPSVIWLLPERTRDSWKLSGMRPSLDSQVYTYSSACQTTASGRGKTI